MNNDIFKVLGGFVGGLAIGGLVGYFVQKKTLEVKYANIASAEIEDVKEHYRLVRKEGYEPPQVTVDIPEKPEEYDQALKDLGYTSDDAPGTVKNIFDHAAVSEEYAKSFEKQEEEDSDVPDSYFSELQEMIEKRNPEEPYVISVGEFQEGDENDNVVLTYFEGDDNVVDESNVIVPDVNRLIGEEALTMFGKFSEDKNIVYVRNERLNLDFEIIRDHRSWTDSLLGIPKSNKIGKMREDD